MSTIRILIVEDEPIVAEDVAERLQKFGYQVVGIEESGGAAIAMATAMRPDLVLMDIVLEGELDGVEAAHIIRQALQIPVVYLTANTDETTLQRAKATVPFGYILKPFKARELQATIEIALSRHQAEQEVQRALAIATDTANQIQSQIQKQIESEQAQRQEYLMMAVHELRTPLSIVKFAASMMRERGHSMPEAEQRRNLTYIESAVGSMNHLIEDVLTLGGLDFPKTAFNPAPLNIVDFCQDMVQAMQWGVGDQYTLKFSTSDHCPIADFDSKLLWHVVNNLLSNAIKYSPQGTTVSLQLSYIQVNQNEERVRLQFQDQGIGIPQPDQESLFEPFHRGSNVGSVPGTGLGLAIAKCAVDLHGGTIAIVSRMGEGTTITVELPLQAPQS
jgi:signal transduction histidine kinase